MHELTTVAQNDVVFLRDFDDRNRVEAKAKYLQAVLLNAILRVLYGHANAEDDAFREARLLIVGHRLLSGIG